MVFGMASKYSLMVRIMPYSLYCIQSPHHTSMVVSPVSSAFCFSVLLVPSRVIWLISTPVFSRIQSCTSL